MKKLKYIILALASFPIFLFAQMGNSGARELYEICTEFKKDCKPGQITLNQKVVIADTTICFITGKVIDGTKDSIPFVPITVTEKSSGKKYSTNTNIDGHYEIILPEGQYTFKATYFGYSPILIETLILIKGEKHNINIQLGEYCCLKKTITSNVPIPEMDK